MNKRKSNKSIRDPEVKETMQIWETNLHEHKQQRWGNRKPYTFDISPTPNLQLLHKYWQEWRGSWRLHFSSPFIPAGSVIKRSPWLSYALLNLIFLLGLILHPYFLECVVCYCQMFYIPMLSQKIPFTILLLWKYDSPLKTLLSWILIQMVTIFLNICKQYLAQNINDDGSIWNI